MQIGNLGWCLSSSEGGPQVSMLKIWLTGRMIAGHIIAILLTGETITFNLIALLAPVCTPLTTLDSSLGNPTMVIIVIMMVIIMVIMVIIKKKLLACCKRA